jgi:WD40 repeat protein
MFRISKAAMDTSLERIRAKIAELEAKIADLRIAEHGRALSASSDSTLRLWDLATSECVRTFEGHSDWVIHHLDPAGQGTSHALDD